MCLQQKPKVQQSCQHVAHVRIGNSESRYNTRQRIAWPQSRVEKSIARHKIDMKWQPCSRPVFTVDVFDTREHGLCVLALSGDLCHNLSSWHERYNDVRRCSVLSMSVASLNSRRRRTDSQCFIERVWCVHADLSALSAWLLHSLLTAIVDTSYR